MRDRKTASPEVQRLKELLDQFKNHSATRIDKTLLNIIETALQKIVTKFKEETDQDKLGYALRLLDDLNALLISQTDDLIESIEELLWQLNFNSRQYFLYYIAKIAAKVQFEETVSARLELLAYEYKQVNQRYSERDICFTTTYCSLHEVVGNWIAEEITFLRTKQQLTITLAHPDNLLSQDFKIALDLSVAQFSCLVRGLKEKKYILNTNITELAEFFSTVVMTKRSENISEGSFRKKYYNMEESTKKSVIDMLNKVIDWLLRN